VCLLVHFIDTKNIHDSRLDGVKINFHSSFPINKSANAHLRRILSLQTRETRENKGSGEDDDEAWICACHLTYRQCQRSTFKFYGLSRLQRMTMTWKGYWIMMMRVGHWRRRVQSRRKLEHAQSSRPAESYSPFPFRPSFLPHCWMPMNMNAEREPDFGFWDDDDDDGVSGVVNRSSETPWIQDQ